MKFKKKFLVDHHYKSMKPKMIENRNESSPSISNLTP